MPRRQKAPSGSQTTRDYREWDKRHYVTVSAANEHLPNHLREFFDQPRILSKDAKISMAPTNQYTQPNTHQGANSLTLTPKGHQHFPHVKPRPPLPHCHDTLASFLAPSFTAVVLSPSLPLLWLYSTAAVRASRQLMMVPYAMTARPDWNYRHHVTASKVT